MIIRHPTLPITKDVSASVVAEWVAAGWIAVHLVGEQGPEPFVTNHSGEVAPVEPKHRRKK